MSPLYDLVLVAHVVAAVFGFGGLAATGAYARAARVGGPSPAVRRYFAPGPNAASVALAVVPLLGIALLALGHWRDAGEAYPWVGLACWLVATGVASAVAWPAERTLQSLLASRAPSEALVQAPAGTGPGPSGPRPGGSIAEACRRCERAAAVASVCFVVALFFMIVQPG